MSDVETIKHSVGNKNYEIRVMEELDGWSVASFYEGNRISPKYSEF